MDERWQQVEALFHSAAQLPPEDRAAFLNESCSDAEVRQEVSELLSAQDESDTRLDGAFGALKEPLEKEASVGEQIGPFQIESVIASGGMGTVYRAKQATPERSVALKLMRRGFEDPTGVRRFEYESQVLARLQHPGIAHVYESGTLREGASERPWFAMELIEGARALTRYAREEKLSLEARIDLMIQACVAVHHGHQKGVIHRDLKPANVLVDVGGRVKIIDFGVAKAIDSELGPGLHETAADQVVGTPRYMSPEQAAGTTSVVDTRTDVHALGLLTFELLTDQLPYGVDGLDIVEALEKIRRAPVDKTPLAESAVPEDLQLVVLSALDKEPDRRFESAAAYAEDLGRFLRHEAVRARAPSAVYQLKKFARRNRALVGSVAAIGVALTLGVSVTTLALLEARAQREEAVAQRAAAETARDDALWGREFLSDLLTSADPWSGDGGLLEFGDVLAVAGERLDADPPSSPAVEMQMRILLGDVMRKVGALEAAETQFRGALRAAKADGVDAAQSQLAAQSGLARTLQQLDRATEAEVIISQVVEAHKGALGEDDPKTLRARDLWAMTLRDLGRRDEAAEALEDVLAQQRKVMGPEHPDTYRTQNNLGTVLYQLAEYARAIELLEPVVAHRNAALGLDHPDTLTATANLAASYAREQRYAESDRLYAQVLEGSKRRLGEDHHRTFTTMSNYAGMLRRFDKLERAEPLSRGAYEGRRRTLGADHSDTLESLSNYAALLYKQERFKEAESLYLDGIAIAERRPEAMARDAVTLRSNYARLLRATGRARMGEPHMRKATDEAHRLYATDHWMPWAVQSNYGDLLLDVDEHERGRKILEEAYRQLVVLRGAENEYTQIARERLVRAYALTGEKDPEQAVRVAGIAG